MNRVYLSVFAAWVFVCMPTRASLLDNLNVSSNVNKPEVWQDQLGGFATGGSLHARVPSSDLRLLHFDLPSLNMGCGGIDLFGGGFGYINSKQLEVLLKQIGTQALSYGAMLTIKSISPTIADLLETLESTARFMNAQNINSCNMAASIASGMFPKTQAAQSLACSTRKMGQDPHSIGSAASNYFTARYDCQNHATLQTVNQQKQDEGFLGADFNLVWKALEKAGKDGGAMSLPDKEFLMTLSGTLIARTKDGKMSFEHKKSLISGSNILDALVFGENIQNLEFYKCTDSDKCLEITKTKQAFKAENSMLYKIRALLDSIAGKIIAENIGGSGSESLTAHEIHMISTTSIPILKIIALNAGLKGHGVTLTIDDYSESIAFDYVVGYLDSLLDFVYESLSQLEYAQSEGQSIRDFKKGLTYTKQMLFNERVKAFERLSTLLSVKQRVSQLEAKVYSSFSQYRS